ncbi:SDR family NAD(P)-dependent oxidoreductase [Mycobacterium branderi]|uniref:Short-chain dehydrogenase n=1 Tax=Mycobacterium branderi TaxID=43348 RepID=A0AA91RJX0_9MYCO|nr:SDR family oxidoreductase [Mycobacterium branderi]MCV7232964.1 SDR family oxidoreductase [Mycobacterium branderi]ORA41078.1 short-chain dehydrogenase [Mycobacterium branderi]
MTTNWPAGQAAFVTGAASGIGLGIARALVAAGAKVALADIDGARLADVAKELTDAGGTVLGVQLDVSDADQWSAAADQAEKALGPISILCNNAGVNGGGLIDETPLEVWRWVFKINTEAQFIGVSTFLPRFKSRGGRAHIVNTASMAGIVPMTRVGAYSSSKFAGVGFSMVLRDELLGTDVGVSVLCPGTVATRINVTAGEAEAKLLGQEINRAALEGNGALLGQGADPDRVGEQVVEAMQQRQFLIITHRDWEPLVARVHGEIRRAYSEFDDRHGPDYTAQILTQGTSPVTT